MLPAGKTESGAWSLNASKASAAFGTYAFAPISFTIPLKAGLDASHIHFQGGANFSTTCHGNAEHPQADSGNLCVYSGLSENVTFEGITSLAFSGSNEANASGALLYFTVTGDEAVALGGWAVTG